jgi:hypothetical protein
VAETSKGQHINKQRTATSRWDLWVLCNRRHVLIHGHPECLGDGLAHPSSYLRVNSYHFPYQSGVQEPAAPELLSIANMVLRYCRNDFVRRSNMVQRSTTRMAIYCNIHGELTENSSRLKPPKWDKQPVLIWHQLLQLLSSRTTLW